MTVRRQATLFLYDESLDALRRQWNPLQAALIDCHVTLLREDEVEDWDEIKNRLLTMPRAFEMEFGKPIREENLVYLPCVEGTESFQSLRATLLQSGSHEPRLHKPHVTLIHPRNGLCTDAIFEAIFQSVEKKRVLIGEVCLIEQVDGGPWSILGRYALEGPTR